MGEGDTEGAGSIVVTGRKRTVVPECEGAPQKDSAKRCWNGAKSLKTNEKEALEQFLTGRLGRGLVRSPTLGTRAPAGARIGDASQESSEAGIGP